MNRTFKTLWNDVRRSFVAVNETQNSHGKPSKTVVALTATAVILGATAASAAYVEQGRLGSTSSWESAEYGSDGYISQKKNQHGLVHVNASTAYAEGYTGKGVLIGVVDSGALLSHSELSGGRIFGVTASGEYSHTGTRYPFYDLKQGGPKLPDGTMAKGDYTKGEAFNVNGDWILGVNDAHGTHVTSVVAGSRDGQNSHGVAFDADIAVGNTGGSDNMNYGPYQDYGYFYAVWDAVGATGAKVINNSWGTNIRINDSTSEHYDVGKHFGSDDGSQEPTLGNRIRPEGSEEEYFLFMKDAEANGGKNFMDAAYEVAAKYGLVQIFTNGNRQFQNPYYRAAYAYYNPEAEKYWIAAGGVDVDEQGNEQVMGWGKTWTGTGAVSEAEGKTNAYNRSGIAKWWGIASATNVLGANVNSTTGEASNRQAGGASNAAPHIAGAMAVLLQRFGTYMDVTQVRDVMFTTARQHQLNDPTKLLPGISQEEAGAPEDDYGWGIVDLGKAIYGPGQFFGTFDVTMNGIADQWDNDITDQAIQLRGKEDALEKAELETRIAQLKAPTKQTDEVRWELGYKQKRLAAIAERERQGYTGKLIKRGNGLLTMTGVNTYTGGTEIYGGTVAGLTESFGSGNVVVKKGATVELHKSFDVTHAGKIDWETTTVTGTAADNTDDAKIVLEAGSTLALAGENISINSLTTNGKASVKASGFTKDQLAGLWSGATKQLAVSAAVVNIDPNVATNLTAGTSDYALFETTGVKVEQNSVTAQLTKSDKTVASFGADANSAAVGAAIESVADSAVMSELVAASAGEISQTLTSLSNDLHLAAQNATLLNSALVARTIKDQASAYGEARRADFENGATLWATGMGSWGSVDAGGASVDMDVDTYAGFIGGEMPYGDGNKVGVFFGYGSTDFDASSDGKIESDDLHFGVYGENTFNAVGVTYGLAYTQQDRDAKRTLVLGQSVAGSALSYDADVLQVFGEVSYKGFSTDTFQVEPYAGVSFIRASADDLSEKVGGHAVKTELEDQNLGLFNIGVRGAMPFTAGTVAMKVKGDVGYMQFVGDNEAEAKMTIGDAGTAKLTGEKLSGLATVGFGIDAAVGQNVTLGVSYTGAFGSDIKSHGIGANIRIRF